MYKQCGLPRDASIVLAEQLHVRGKTSHGHFYERDGGRCSGDPNTSVGNSLLNAMALLWALWVCMVSVQSIRIIVLGDDSVTAIKEKPDDPEFSDKIIHALQRLGFKVKLKVHEDPDLVEFCSGRFWCTTEGRVWGPKPGRWLSKIGFSVGSEEKPLTWFKGVLLGVKQNTAHVPVLGATVKHLLTMLTHVKAKASQPESYLKINVTKEHKPSPDTF